MTRFQRETAHRVFASEFNASDLMIEGQGEMEPSYLITPLGGKVNRVHVVGVCTEVEPVGEAGDMVRARISDPTGVYAVYAGQYQPEAAAALNEIQPPCFLAVTGKARTYEPEPGSVLCSIRPEQVHVVDEATRDQWLVDAAKHTARRAKAFKQAGPDVADAREHYGPDATAHVSAAANAIASLLGGQVIVHESPAAADDGGYDAPAPAPAPMATAAPGGQTQADEGDDELDDSVLAIVQELEGDKGAQWDDILGRAAVGPVTADDVDEALNRLMDKGLVYEPTLGVLKTT